MDLSLPESSRHWILTLEAAFFVVLFLQSGLDKVLNWKSNLQFHREHFSNSPLASVSLPMLAVLTLLEIVAGSLAVAVILLLDVHPESQLVRCGFYLPAVIFLCLFFGQRLARDYAGAAALVPYFLLALFGILVAG
jgi:uncharacterized membrane protein YphA (DoxX/SURF4 family)